MRTAVLCGGLLALGAVVVLGLLGGSPNRLPAGTRIAGVGVGGLTAAAATERLEQRANDLERTPVEFVAGGRRFRLSASQLGVRSDWEGAVRRAVAQTGGIAPVRGLRRIQTRLFGADIEPPVHAYPSVLRHTVAQIASDVDRPAVDASLLRRGLAFRVRPEASGTRLDREAASSAVVAALASLLRGGPVRLPTVVTPPKVTREQLAAASRAAATAVSAPVTFTVGPTRFRLPRWRIAQLLDLPDGGKTDVEIGGAKARSWLSALERSVRRSPRDATFKVVAGGIEIVPSRPGRALDLDAARSAVERAVFSATNRSATLATHLTEPARTTADAKAMGITGVVGSYTTTYGGTPGRIHNVQLVAELIDGALIAPGSRFSFNQTTGERNAEKGFEEAPVIINGELQTGIGGGVCQVSTTIFNAAFEAGLSIERRTNHALYISHYPRRPRRDGQLPGHRPRVPNDTDSWLLVRTFVNAGSLTVNLYGTPQGRRVETETAPLMVDGKIRIKRIKDQDDARGQALVESMGEPPRTTSVRRKVYAPDGALLYDTTWSSYYAGEPTIVRVGTKPKPKPVEAEHPTSPSAALPPAGRDARPSALRTSATNHSGTRVGRWVAASTVACVVHPSRCARPARSTTYS